MRTIPLVSIIIVNLDGGRVFGNCLLSLGKIIYPNWELIVVDNGSADGSQKLLWDYQLPIAKSKFRYIKNQVFAITNYQLIQNKKNFGFAKANNQGYRVSKGKYILILNNDTQVEKNFLNMMVEKMEKHPTIGVLQPKIKIMDDPKFLDNAGSFLTRIGFLHHWGFMKKDSLEYDKEREVFSTKGACMLIRKSVIEKIGLFDPDFMSYFEESDFCWRVWLSGYKVLFYPKARIYHKVGFTIKRLDVGNINYHYYKNRIASLIKNLNLINLLLIVPVHLFVSLGIATVFLVRGNFSNSLMILRAIGWNINHLSKTLNKRKRIQKQRQVSDKDLFSKLTRPVDFGKFYSDFKRVEEDIKRKQ